MCAVLASTATDSAGRYSFDVPSNTDVSLRVRAEVIHIPDTPPRLAGG